MSKKILRFFFILAMVWFPTVRASIALDLETSPGHVAKTYEVDLRGGLAYLPDGDVVGFSGVNSAGGNPSVVGDSFDLVRVELHKHLDQMVVGSESVESLKADTEKLEPVVTVLKTFSGGLAPAFVRSSSGGSFVYLGTAGALGKIFSLSSDSLELREVVARSGLRDLVSIDEQTAYILYQDESSRLLVAVLRLEPTLEIVPVLQLDSGDYHALAIMADSSLYVVSDVGSRSLAKRFDSSVLSQALESQTLLTEADVQHSLDLPKVQDIFGRSFFFASGATGEGFSNPGPEDSITPPSDDDMGGEPVEPIQGEPVWDDSVGGGFGDDDIGVVDCAPGDDCSDVTEENTTGTTECVSDDSSVCVSPTEELIFEPWVWDELYVLSAERLTYYPSFAGTDSANLEDIKRFASIQSDPIQLLQGREGSPVAFSRLAVGWFSTFGMWCNIRPTVAAAVTDLSNGKYYLVEVSADPLSEEDNLACVDYLPLDGGEVESQSTVNAPGLRGDAYSLWNSFLGMVNVLELTNTGNQDEQASVSIFGQDGQVMASAKITVAAGIQRDLVLNDLSGFLKDNYGTLKVESRGSIDGRILFYRGRADFASFDFAFAVPLRKPDFGTSVAGFNTFNPGTSAEDAGHVVANWFSVANLGEQRAKFRVERRDATGKVINSELVVLPAMGRVDLEGGHVNPGPAHVGLIRVVPEDSGSPYIAQLVRYGLDDAGSFGFALPVTSEQGSSMPLVAGISVEDGANNWLEVINVGSESGNVDVTCYDAQGTVISKQKLELGGLSQVHVNVSSGLVSLELASARLGDSEFGSCEVDSSSGSSLVVESMKYYSEPQSGGVETASAAKGRPFVSTDIDGSYNSFLEMESELRLSNLTNQDATARVAIFGSAGSQGEKLDEKSVRIPAKSSLSLNLRDRNAFNIKVNTYGIVRVTSDRAIFGEMLRKRRNAGGVLDFIISTDVR